MSYHIVKIIVIVSLLLMQNGCNKPSEPIDNPPEKDTIPNYDEGCTSGVTNPSVKGKILFTSRRTGEYQQLFMMDPDGSNIEQLTFGNYSSLMGRWSKDGKMIVFQSDTPKTTLGIPVYVMNSNGSNKHPLLPNYYYNQFPLVGSPLDWLYDNKRIIVSGCKPCDPYPDYKLYIINENDNSYQTLTDLLPAKGFSPNFSPDNSKIALNGITKIYIFDSDFSNLKKIDVDTAFTDIAWSPDGCKIVYGGITKTNRRGEIFIIRLETNSKEQITFRTDNANIFAPRWSPDSKNVVFYIETIPGVENGYKQETYVCVVNIETKQVRKIIDDPTAAYPDWSWSEINE